MSAIPAIFSGPRSSMGKGLQLLRCLCSSVFQGFRFQLQISVISVNQWYVFLADGKKDLLAALHRAGCCDGTSSPAVVEPGAYLAAARLMLVGGLPQRYWY